MFELHGDKDSGRIYWFEGITSGMSEEQKGDLKKKKFKRDNEIIKPEDWMTEIADDRDRIRHRRAF